MKYEWVNDCLSYYISRLFWAYETRSNIFQGGFLFMCSTTSQGGDTNARESLNSFCASMFNDRFNN